MATDAKWNALNQTILDDGYQWVGAAFLPSDIEDGFSCPNCDECGYWTVQYQDEKNNVFANLCYDCGHMWREAFPREPELED